MQLFIDTNIYLDYFRAISTDRLEPLRRLVELVDSGEIKLLLPDQTSHEYQRNRRKVAEETREVLLEAGKRAPFAHLVLGKNKREVKAVSAAVKQVQEAFKKLIAKYDEQIEAENTEADKLLKRLFKKAIRISESDETIQKAHKRYMRGNPPRKSDYSYGDAITWEALLEEGISEPLTIISKDSDYTEKHKGKKVLSSFLKSEWKTKSSHNLEFFESLGEFINHFDKKDTIKKEIVESEKSPSPWASVDSMRYRLATTVLDSARLDTPSFVAGNLASKSVYATSVDPNQIFYPDTEPWQYSSVLAATHNSIPFCPYCGAKDPISNDVVFTVFTGRVCRVCKKTISLN